VVAAWAPVAQSGSAGTGFQSVPTYVKFVVVDEQGTVLESVQSGAYPAVGG
jgi:hypothetical protein